MTLLRKYRKRNLKYDLKINAKFNNSFVQLIKNLRIIPKFHEILKIYDFTKRL